MRSDLRYVLVALAAAVAMPASAALRLTDLAPGRMTYRISIDGAPRGEQIIEVRRDAPERFTITMNAAQIGQRWTATSDAGFAPGDVTLEMPTRAGPYRMALRYKDARVTGTHGTNATPVDDAVPPGIVDQRVDWAYVAAAQLRRGARLSFNVYDPVTKVSRAEVHGLGRGWIDVGGKRTAVNSTAYRIRKPSGDEHYVVHVAAAGPAVMVREDMPNGLRIDLVDFTASPR